MIYFQLAAISMESPPSSRNSDSSPESEEDKDEEIEVIECWLLFMSHKLWFIGRQWWRIKPDDDKAVHHKQYL